MATYDLPQTIKAIEKKFKDGVWGFTLPTQFGVLVVEEMTEDFDPMSPVYVSQWLNAPYTNVTNRFRSYNADYYVGIANTATRYSRHAHVVEAVMKVMFMATIGEVPSEDIVDAAVQVYLVKRERRNTSINAMVEEMRTVNCDMLTRMSNTVGMFTQKVVELRVAAAERVLKRSKELLMAHGFGIDFVDFFKEFFYADMFGILLYCVEQNPALQPRFNQQRFRGIAVKERECEIRFLTE